MYKPSYFNEESPEKLHNLIRENSFATLISVVKGEPVISHLPFFLKGEDKKTFLLSHLRKKNIKKIHYRTMLHLTLLTVQSCTYTTYTYLT